MSSFIKLPREIFKSEYWQEKRVFSKAEAYIDLLSFAPYKDEDNLRKAEFILSRRNMELRWLWSGTKVTNFINELIKLISFNNDALILLNIIKASLFLFFVNL